MSDNQRLDFPLDASSVEVDMYKGGLKVASTKIYLDVEISNEIKLKEES